MYGKLSLGNTIADTHNIEISPVSNEKHIVFFKFPRVSNQMF